jgi:hypothetical protein
MVDLLTDLTRRSTLVGGDVNSVSIRWVARGAGILGASAALIFGLAGASVAAPAVVPSVDIPSTGTYVQYPDVVERCRDKVAVHNDADL